MITPNQAFVDYGRGVSRFVESISQALNKWLDCMTVPQVVGTCCCINNLSFLAFKSEFLSLSFLFFEIIMLTDENQKI
jgi:hypothetical protein